MKEITDIALWIDSGKLSFNATGLYGCSASYELDDVGNKDDCLEHIADRISDGREFSEYTRLRSDNGIHVYQVVWGDIPEPGDEYKRAWDFDSDKHKPIKKVIEPDTSDDALSRFRLVCKEFGLKSKPGNNNKRASVKLKGTGSEVAAISYLASKDMWLMSIYGYNKADYPNHKQSKTARGKMRIAVDFYGDGSLDMLRQHITRRIESNG